jgi:hypothetical protein
MFLTVEEILTARVAVEPLSDGRAQAMPAGFADLPA